MVEQDDGGVVALAEAVFALAALQQEFSGQKFETIVLQFEGEQKLIIPTSELFRLTPWNGEGEPEADSLSSKRWRSALKKARF